MPRPAHLWLLFVLGVAVSTACLLPLTVVGANALTLVLRHGLAASLIGFSTPVCLVVHHETGILASIFLAER